MRKLVLLLLLLIVTGCNQLNDNILGISNRYEGTWICTEGDILGKTVIINSDGSLKYDNITIPSALIIKHSNDHYSASTTVSGKVFSLDILFTTDTTATVKADSKSGIFTKQ